MRRGANKLRAVCKGGDVQRPSVCNRMERSRLIPVYLKSDQDG